MFKTCINARGDTLNVKTYPGDAEKVVFTQILNDRGEHVLVVDEGKAYSLYNEIQKYAKETDINEIVERYLNGDPSVMSKRTAQYGDFINVPSSYREYLDVAIRAQEAFNSLDPEERNKYGSLEGFLMSFDNSVEKPVENDTVKEEINNDSEE